MLNRSFNEGKHSMSIHIQYPIQIVYIKSNPLCIGKGEKGNIQVQIKNISSILYGCKHSSYKDSNTQNNPSFNYDIGIIISPRRPDLLKCISPVAIPQKDFNNNKNWCIRIGSLEPQKTTNLQVPIELDSNCIPMDQFFCDIYLTLRERIIQFETCVVRCVEEYNPNDSSEILIFTGSHINLKEWNIWQDIAKHFLIKINYYDIEKQNGISSQWLQNQSHKILIFSFSQSRDIQYLNGSDLSKFILNNQNWKNNVFLQSPYEIFSSSVESSSSSNNNNNLDDLNNFKYFYSPCCLFFNCDSSRIANLLVCFSQDRIRYKDQFHSFSVSFGGISEETKKKYCIDAQIGASNFVEEHEKKDPNYLYSTLFIDLPPEKERFQRLHWNFGECEIGRMILPKNSYPIHIVVDESPSSSVFFDIANKDEKMSFYPNQEFSSTFSKIIVILYRCFPFMKKLEIFTILHSQMLDQGIISFDVNDKLNSISPNLLTTSNLIDNDFIWSLHPLDFNNFPDCLDKKSKFSLIDIFLSLLCEELLIEFDNTNCYDLPLLQKMTLEFTIDSSNYFHMKVVIYKILLQMDKLTFWRLPTLFHKRKRRILKECTEKIEKLFFPLSNEISKLKKKLKEPYIRLDVINEYKKLFCWPTQQAHISEDLNYPSGQYNEFGHYQSSSLFYKRFYGLKDSNDVEKFKNLNRLVSPPLWNFIDDVNIFIDGYSTLEAPNKKLYTGFHVVVCHKNDKWKLAKSYSQFESFEETVSFFLLILKKYLIFQSKVKFFCLF